VRWGLRGTAIVYLGLTIALPTIAVISKGFSDGLQSLEAALQAPGAREAILLTLALAAFCAIVNVVFGTLIAYLLVRY
jgi:sulfate/thiosulfate transport system permease protein